MFHIMQNPLLNVFSTLLCVTGVSWSHQNIKNPLCFSRILYQFKPHQMPNLTFTSAKCSLLSCISKLVAPPLLSLILSASIDQHYQSVDSKSQFSLYIVYRSFSISLFIFYSIFRRIEDLLSFMEISSQRLQKCGMFVGTISPLTAFWSSSWIQSWIWFKTKTQGWIVVEKQEEKTLSNTVNSCPVSFWPMFSSWTINWIKSGPECGTKEPFGTVAYFVSQQLMWSEEYLSPFAFLLPLAWTPCYSLPSLLPYPVHILYHHCHLHSTTSG